MFVRCFLSVVMGLAALAAPHAFAAEPQDLKWRDLVPKAAAAAALKPKTFFSGATPADPDTPPSSSSGAPAAPGGDAAGAPEPIPEGRFMQMKRRQPGAGAPPRIVPELDGKTVRIGGYVVPLDFEATRVKEFLLVPFVGACVHVPPPPANQIIYVKIDEGFEVAGTFDPVTVTGTLNTAVAFTGLADAGYTLRATQVVPRTE